MIDYKNISIDTLNKVSENTLAETLQMEVIQIDVDALTMKMPVVQAHKQPVGYLHGGATIALAENVASLASNLWFGGEKTCFGLQVNAHHIKACKEGWIYAKATIAHGGKSTQVWEVRITNDEEELVSLCTVTMMVINQKSKLTG